MLDRQGRGKSRARLESDDAALAILHVEARTRLDVFLRMSEERLDGCGEVRSGDMVLRGKRLLEQSGHHLPLVALAKEFEVLGRQEVGDVIGIVGHRRLLQWLCRRRPLAEHDGRTSRWYALGLVGLNARNSRQRAMQRSAPSMNVLSLRAASAIDCACANIGSSVSGTGAFVGVR
jgi:hypothetical protein